MRDNDVAGLVVGLVIGAAIGATTALLLAPKSGKELRGDIMDKLEDAKDELSKVTCDLKEIAIEKGHIAKDLATEKIHEAQDMISETISAIKEKAQAE